MKLIRKTCLMILLATILFLLGCTNEEKDSLTLETYKVPTVAEKPLTEIEKARFETKSEEKWVLTKVEYEPVNDKKYVTEEWKYDNGNMIYYKNAFYYSQLGGFNGYADLFGHEVIDFEVFFNYDDFNRITTREIRGNKIRLYDSKDYVKGKILEKYKYDVRGRVGIKKIFFNEDLVADYHYMYEVYEDGKIQRELSINTVENGWGYKFEKQYDERGNLLKDIKYRLNPDGSESQEFIEYIYDEKNRWTVKKEGETYVVNDVGANETRNEVLQDRETTREYLSDSEYIETRFYVSYKGQGVYDKLIDFKYRYVLDKNGKITEGIIYSESKDSNGKYLRDEKNQILFETIDSKYINIYDEKGSFVEKKYYSKQSQNWINLKEESYELYKYTYDDNGNRLTKEKYIDKELNGVRKYLGTYYYNKNKLIINMN